MGFAVEEILVIVGGGILWFLPLVVDPFGLDLTEDGVQRTLDDLLAFCFKAAPAGRVLVPLSTLVCFRQ